MQVLVIGAGPAGSAAAIELARGGASVRVVEKARWPRAKTCGDGIAPLGVREALALGVDFADRPKLELGEISTPGGLVSRSGWRDDTPWGTIVERVDFDARLMALAVAAGAAFSDGTSVEEISLAGARPAAKLSSSGATEAFDAIVLAEGATGSLATRLGFGRHATRLVALRGYATAERDLDPVFGLYFDRCVAPGYGWIFPLTARHANVGLLVGEGVAKRKHDLRELLQQWVAQNPVAPNVLGKAPRFERLSGGVIPTGRRSRVRGGVFLVGDAAGVADPFSAEGIFQAMATGRAAAQALLASGGDLRRAAPAYARALRPFDRNAREARRFRLGFSYVMDPLMRRAQTRPALARHLSANGMFMKESLPAFLWGIARNW
jgi:geranylgeranyl reductase family protein